MSDGKLCELDEFSLLRNQTFHEQLKSVYTEVQAYLNESLDSAYWSVVILNYSKVPLFTFELFLSRNHTTNNYSMPVPGKLDNIMNVTRYCLGLSRYFVIAFGFFGKFLFPSSSDSPFSSPSLLHRRLSLLLVVHALLRLRQRLHNALIRACRQTPQNEANGERVAD